MWSPVAAQTWEAPIFSGEDESYPLTSNPCHCIGTDLDKGLRGLVGASPWLQVVGLATHNRLFLSIFLSPLPTLFIMLKLFFPSFSSAYHIHVDCSSSHCRWAIWLQGLWVTSTLHCVVWLHAGL